MAGPPIHSTIGPLLHFAYGVNTLELQMAWNFRAESADNRPIFRAKGYTP